MKRVVTIQLADGSDLIAWYESKTREIVELYHELPMEGNPPTASHLLNISAMIPAIRLRKPPLAQVEAAIFKAIIAREGT